MVMAGYIVVVFHILSGRRKLIPVPAIGLDPPGKNCFPVVDFV